MEHQLGVCLNLKSVSFFFFKFWTNIDQFLFVFLIAVLWPLQYYYQRCPVNFILLGLFTVAISFAVGSTCAIPSGMFFWTSVQLINWYFCRFFCAWFASKLVRTLGPWLNKLVNMLHKVFLCCPCKIQH